MPPYSIFFKKIAGLSFKLWLALPLLTIFSCKKLSNAYERAVLDCGENFASENSYVKLRGPKGEELEGSELSALVWRSNRLEPLSVSKKACVNVGDNETLIIRDRRTGSVLAAGEQSWEDVVQLSLEPSSESQLLAACPAPQINYDAQLLAGIQKPRARTASYHLQANLRNKDGKLLEERAFLISQRQDEVLNWTMSRGYAEGSYTISLRIENLLRDSEKISLECPIDLDASPPEAKAEIAAAAQKVQGLYQMIEARSDLNFALNDKFPTKLKSCWVPIAETDSPEESEAALAAAPACELLAQGESLQVPAKGYWLLRYQGQDTAGNLSPIQSLPLLSYNGAVIERIRLLSDAVSYDVEEMHNPFQGMVKALEADALRRGLSTKFEKQAARIFADRALYKLVHKNIPLHEVPINEGVFEMVAHPDHRSFTLITAQTGQILTFDSEARLLWQDSLGEVPISRTISRGGEYLAVGTASGKIWVWQPKSGERLGTFVAPARLEVLQFDPRAQLLTGILPNSQIYIWDILNSESGTTLPESEQPFGGYSWNPNGDSLVVGRKNKAYAYARDGKILETKALAAETGRVVQIKHLDATHLFALSVDRTPPQTPDDLVTKVQILNAKFEVLKEDGLKVINPSPTGRIAADSLQMPDRIAVSPDGAHVLAFGRMQKGVKVWFNWAEALKEGGQLNLLETTFNALPESFEDVTWQADSQQILGRTMKGAVAAFNRAGDIITQLRSQDTDFIGSPYALLDKENRFAVRGSDGKMRLWPIQSRLFPSYFSPVGWINHFAESPDGQHYMTIEYDPVLMVKVKIFNAQFQQLHEWQYPGQRTLELYSMADIKALLRSAAFLDNGTLVLGDSSGLIYFKNFDGSDAAPVGAFGLSQATPIPPDQYLSTFALAPDKGQMFLGFTNGSVSLIDLKKKELIKHGPGHGPAAAPMPGLPNNYVLKTLYDAAEQRFLSAASDGKILAWKNDELNAEELRSFNLPIDGFMRTEDGRMMAVIYRQGSVEVLDGGGASIAKLSALNRSTPVLAGEAQGRFYAAGEGRNVFGSPLTFLWDGQGVLLHTFNFGFPTVIEHLSFTRDNRFLRIASYNRLLEIPVDPAEIVKKMCAVHGASITAENSELCSGEGEL